MAVGNTFGATALSSYGGFWIAYGILLTPEWNILGPGGPYATAAAAGGDPTQGDSALGFFLTGWFIFTTILLILTLRSTVMFFMLFFTLDLAFLMLACGAYAVDNGNPHAAEQLNKAGGGFGMLAAFLAWYNAFAGMADTRYVSSSSSSASRNEPYRPGGICYPRAACIGSFGGRVILFSFPSFLFPRKKKIPGTWIGRAGFSLSVLAFALLVVVRSPGPTWLQATSVIQSLHTQVRDMPE